MSPSRVPATLIAITLSAILTEPIGSGRAHAAVLCKSRTGAVVVRGSCKKKESQVNLIDFLPSGPGGPGTEPADADNVSGSRLRAQMLIGSDGTREFESWFDSQLQVNCTFSTYVRASDGKIRCLPLYYETLDYRTVTQNDLFKDAACSQVLRTVFRQETQCPPKYVVRVITQQCPLTEAFYPLVAPRDWGIVYYNNCTSTTTPPYYVCQCSVYPDTDVYYVVGDEVPPSTFVGAAELVE